MKWPIIALLRPSKLLARVMGVSLSLGLLIASHAYAIDDDRLANAIYKAEGVKSRHPYGILAKYKHTTPRQACINTIRSAKKRFAKQNQETDFIRFLGLTYCPVGAKNDPTGLNKNWVKNVTHFYERG